MFASTSVLTQAQLAAIGEIAVESAYLDGMVDFLIAQILNISEEKYYVVSNGVMLGTKLDILRNLGLIRLRSKKRKLEWENIVSQVKHLNSQRTIAIHGYWQSKHGRKLSDLNKETWILPSGEAQAVHKRGKKKPSILDAQNLQKLAYDIHDNRNKLMIFYANSWMKGSIRETFIRMAK